MPHRAEQKPEGGAIVSPQAAVATQGTGRPEQDGCCHLGDDSALGSWHLLSALSPNLPTPVSPQTSLAQSAPAFAGAMGKWLQMKICALDL